jgi:hypothetical protein
MNAPTSPASALREAVPRRRALPPPETASAPAAQMIASIGSPKWRRPICAASAAAGGQNKLVRRGHWARRSEALHDRTAHPQQARAPEAPPRGLGRCVDRSAAVRRDRGGVCARRNQRRDPACKSIRLQAKRFLAELKLQKRRDFPYRFDVDKAERVCRFIERCPTPRASGRGRRTRSASSRGRSGSCAAPSGGCARRAGCGASASCSSSCRGRTASRRCPPASGSTCSAPTASSAPRSIRARPTRSRPGRSSSPPA